MEHRETNRYQVEALLNAQECAQACDRCAAACLEEADVAALKNCIALDLDCAEICKALVGSLSRNSIFHGELAGVCADICDACAEECARHAHMAHCLECAEACRRCAESCRSLTLLPA
jgi:hypothetical protein